MDSRLLVQSGVGWASGMVGQTAFGTGERSLMGRALATDGPLIVEDFAGESRRLLPSPLLEHGLSSGIFLRTGPAQTPVSVFAAFNREPRTFSQDQLTALEALGRLFELCVGSLDEEEVLHWDRVRIEQGKREWEATVDALPHFICLLDERGKIIRANRSAGHWVQSPSRDVRERSMHEVLHPDCHAADCYMRASEDGAWGALGSGRRTVFEVYDKVLQKHLEVQVRPITRPAVNGACQSSLSVVVLQDIGKIKTAEALLKNNNVRLEELVQSRTNELIQTNECLRREIVERRRMEDALRQSETSLRHLSAQLLSAQEAERKSVVNDLHDGISQSLTAIKFAIENAAMLGAFPDGRKYHELIDPIVAGVQTAIDDVHRISMNLRPSMLDDLGIIPTIGWYCREFRLMHRDVQLKTYIEISEEEVPAELKSVIYRIMQAALDNVARHAEAEYCGVHLATRGSAIEFMVQDNGVGFDAGAAVWRDGTQRGSGVIGMRERIEASHGEFFMTSNYGRGTTVRALWRRLQ